jgi:hypothetical protein
MVQAENGFARITIAAKPRVTNTAPAVSISGYNSTTNVCGHPYSLQIPQLADPAEVGGVGD